MQHNVNNLGNVSQISVEAVQSCQFFGIQYRDANGARQQLICFEMGGTVYIPANAQEYVKQVVAASPAICAAVLQHRAAASSTSGAPVAQPVVDIT